MMISYNRLYKLLDKKGESCNSLFKQGVLTDYARRKVKNGGYVDVKHLALICRHFNVPIEDIIEVVPASNIDS